MKKRYACILISILLICAIMGSFVACNNAPLNLYEFAKKSEFSFGRFIEDEIMHNGYRLTHDVRYDEATTAAIDPYFTKQPALMMENDVFFCDMMSILQRLYNSSVSSFAESESSITSDIVQALTEQLLIDYSERKRICFISSEWVLTKSDITNTEVGAIIELGEYEKVAGKHGRLLNDVQNGNYTYRLAVVYGGDANKELTFDSFNLEIIVCALNENDKIVGELVGLCELFWYPEDSYEASLVFDYGHKAVTYALQNATNEELLELCSSYFRVMEEVIDAWISNPRGKAYIDKHYK